MKICKGQYIYLQEPNHFQGGIACALSAEQIYKGTSLELK